MTTIRINGTTRDVDADPQIPLLWAIRDILGLTGTKFGCGIGACGACTVHMDGQAVRSCITPLSATNGHEIITIEGLSPDGNHRSSAPGVPTTSRNAAIANPARSCRPRHCFGKPRSRPASKSSMPCRATSAGAEPMRASARPSSQLRRQRNVYDRKHEPA